MNKSVVVVVAPAVAGNNAATVAEAVKRVVRCWDGVPAGCTPNLRGLRVVGRSLLSIALLAAMSANAEEPVVVARESKVLQHAFKCVVNGDVVYQQTECPSDTTDGKVFEYRSLKLLANDHTFSDDKDERSVQVCDTTSVSVGRVTQQHSECKEGTKKDKPLVRVDGGLVYSEKDLATYRQEQQVAFNTPTPEKELETLKYQESQIKAKEKEAAKIAATKAKLLEGSNVCLKEIGRATKKDVVVQNTPSIDFLTDSGQVQQRITLTVVLPDSSETKTFKCILSPDKSRVSTLIAIRSN